MKKFVSMFLAVCAMSAMSVSAFAQQAGAVNVTSDQAMKLSFGEETFNQMLLPGETYTYPLYLEGEDGTLVPLSDELLKDVKLRAEKKGGKSAVASFQVEEKDNTYQLEVKTQAGWPTEQTEVEGAVKAVKRSNGQVVGTAEVELTVGYPTIRDEALSAAKADEYILFDNSAPVISEKQFQQLDRDVNGGKVTFTNGQWNYRVRISGQEAVNLLHNERAIKEVSSKFEDQNFKYVSFPGGPSFDFTGTLTIDVSDEMEEFGGSFYVYRYLRGALEKIDATVDLDEETISFETKNLGRFVITDREIADGTVVDESFLPQIEQQTEIPSEQSVQQEVSARMIENQDYRSGESEKGNPKTGAEDYTALAAAAASVSILAGAVLKRSKR
ncbi:MAG: hypothetical protein U0K65_07945 [Negativibacillus sp.]|nr:hypothetical protein [Negativibacillus sp.]